MFSSERQKEKTQTVCRREDHVKTEAEIEPVWPRAKERLASPATTKSWQRPETDSPLTILKEPPSPHLDFSLPALRTEREDISATSLSHQVYSDLAVAALGNKHTYPPIFRFIFFCSLASASLQVEDKSSIRKKKIKEQNRHAELLSFI